MGVLSATLVACVIGWFYKKGKPKVEDFREVIAQLGDPILIEKKLTELLSESQKLPDNSIYIKILAEIALSQAMQKKFEQSHQTLDTALSVCKKDDYEGQVSILLGRSKVFQQAGNLEQAQCYFEESYQLSKKHGLK